MGLRLLSGNDEITKEELRVAVGSRNQPVMLLSTFRCLTELVVEAVEVFERKTTKRNLQAELVKDHETSQ